MPPGWPAMPPTAPGAPEPGPGRRSRRGSPLGSPGAAEGRQVRELVEGLSRRLEEHRRLAVRLTGGLGGPDAATLTEAVEDLAATIEELSVAAEELQRGNDMLVAARAEIDEE